MAKINAADLLADGQGEVIEAPKPAVKAPRAKPTAAELMAEGAEVLDAPDAGPAGLGTPEQIEEMKASSAAAEAQHPVAELEATIAEQEAKKKYPDALHLKAGAHPPVPTNARGFLSPGNAFEGGNGAAIVSGLNSAALGAMPQVMAAKDGLDAVTGLPPREVTDVPSAIGKLGDLKVAGENAALKFIDNPAAVMKQAYEAYQKRVPEYRQALGKQFEAHPVESFGGAMLAGAASGPKSVVQAGLGGLVQGFNGSEELSQGHTDNASLYNTAKSAVTGGALGAGGFKHPILTGAGSMGIAAYGKSPVRKLEEYLGIEEASKDPKVDFSDLSPAERVNLALSGAYGAGAGLRHWYDGGAKAKAQGRVAESIVGEDHEVAANMDRSARSQAAKDLMEQRAGQRADREAISQKTKDAAGIVDVAEKMNAKADELNPDPKWLDSAKEEHAGRNFVQSVSEEAKAKVPEVARELEKTRLPEIEADFAKKKAGEAKKIDGAVAKERGLVADDFKAQQAIDKANKARMDSALKKTRAEENRAYAQEQADASGGVSGSDKVAEALHAKANAFESRIPARVQSKEAAEFGNLVNRVANLKTLGQEVPPEMQAAVDRYVKNSPAAVAEFLADKDSGRLAQEYQGELQSELAVLRAKAEAAREGSAGREKKARGAKAEMPADRRLPFDEILKNEGMYEAAQKYPEYEETRVHGAPPPDEEIPFSQPDPLELGHFGPMTPEEEAVYAPRPKFLKMDHAIFRAGEDIQNLAKGHDDYEKTYVRGEADPRLPSDEKPPGVASVSMRAPRQSSDGDRVQKLKVPQKAPEAFTEPARAPSERRAMVAEAKMPEPVAPEDAALWKARRAQALNQLLGDMPGKLPGLEPRPKDGFVGSRAKLAPEAELPLPEWAWDPNAKPREIVKPNVSEMAAKSAYADVVPNKEKFPARVQKKVDDAPNIKDSVIDHVGKAGGSWLAGIKGLAKVPEVQVKAFQKIEKVLMLDPEFNKRYGKILTSAATRGPTGVMATIAVLQKEKRFRDAINAAPLPAPEDTGD